MKAVVPTIRQGGCNTTFVMPNLVPPLTSASDALAYKARLQEQDSSINFLMSLYLHEKITPAVVKGAKVSQRKPYINNTHAGLVSRPRESSASRVILPESRRIQALGSYPTSLFTQVTHP